jgi:hypothetical protein
MMLSLKMRMGNFIFTDQNYIHQASNTEHCKYQIT